MTSTIDERQRTTTAGRAPRSGVKRAVSRLYLRLTRRSTLLVVFGAIVYVVVEAVAYVQTYPDQASREQLAALGDEPAVRMLQGIPHGVDAVGGFVVWDGGWFLQALVGIWAVMTTSRLLRGEEDPGRVEYVGVGSISLTRASLIAVLIVIGGCALIGLGVMATMLVAGAEFLGSVLFGLGVMGFGSFFVAVTALACQVVAIRRRAVAVASTLLGLGFLLRMVSNSSDGRAWVGWLSPFGWMDKLQPYGSNAVGVLLLYAFVSSLLVGGALWLRSRRDTGGSLIAERAQPRSHLRLLGSPLTFAWRASRATLIGWAVGLALYALMIGSLLQAMTEFLAGDPNYQRLLDSLGWDAADTARGFLGVMGIVIGLIVALYVAWRIGAARQEESSERLEHLLTRPVKRWRWLGGHVLLAIASTALLLVVTGGMTWVGSLPTDATFSLADAVASTLNLLPLALLFGGIAVAVFGLAPRLTVAVPVGAVFATYVLSLVGPGMDLPGWLIGISPFYHVAYVPADPFAWPAAVVMLGLAAGGVLVGTTAFQRRDLVGA